jgi:hypothetical protein
MMNLHCFLLAEYLEEENEQFAHRLYKSIVWIFDDI